MLFMLCAPVWFHHSRVVSAFACFFISFFFFRHSANVAATLIVIVSFLLLLLLPPLFAAVQFAVMKPDGIGDVVCARSYYAMADRGFIFAILIYFERSQKHIALNVFVCVCILRGATRICACV